MFLNLPNSYISVSRPLIPTPALMLPRRRDTNGQNLGDYSGDKPQKIQKLASVVSCYMIVYDYLVQLIYSMKN